MEYFAIGLMSGTSLDGLDICYAKFDQRGEVWRFKILEAETISYSKNWEDQLKNSFYLDSEKLLELNSEYGFYLAYQVKNFIKKKSIKKIDIISSHGHTVFHQPDKKFTLQIGDGRAIKIINKIPVVYDFRSQDVLMGGNGAPLVPIGDELLFSEFDACLNLGGFSNISFRQNEKRIAFDICPVNIVLNKIANQIGKKYDENGSTAKQGKIDKTLLKNLDKIEFYNLPHPKSLGFEWLNDNIFPYLDHQSPENLLATFSTHIVNQIHEVFKKYKLKNVMITGGGAYNTYLIESLRQKTKSNIYIPENMIVEYKEALIFAFMGILKMLNQNNVLSSSTGSFKDHSSGILI